ncbi:MAG: universal stress protein [Desulfobacterales bacterium]|nr:universal stress protein [Desulfobacterales bacterium]
MGAAKKIMAAVGMNRYTEGLMRYATDIADSMRAELICVNIINARDVEAVGTIADMGYEIDGDNYVSSIKAERQQAFAGIIKKIGLSTDRVRMVLKVGDPSEELLKITVKENVELLIMGIKSRSDIEYALIGSVAEKVFRRSPIPILSYRDKETAERLKKHIRLS